MYTTPSTSPSSLLANTPATGSATPRLSARRAARPAARERRYVDPAAPRSGRPVGGGSCRRAGDSVTRAVAAH